MADKAELERQKRAGESAQRMLENEQFKACVKALRDNALEEFRKADPKDVTALQTAHIHYMIVEEFINEFTKVGQQGYMAAHNLKANK